jgi:hypothetical protein
MRETPTDRGYVFIEQNGETSNIFVSVSRDAAGEPVEIYARHFRRREVAIDPEVRLLPMGNMLASAETASVFADASGRVHIKHPR